VTDAESAWPVLDAAWRDLTGGEPPSIELTGAAALPGAFRVAEAAVAAVGCALLAAARWRGARAVALGVADATGAFLAERRLLVDGVAPTFWDPLAGDHLATDGWVRLHTNYAAHRAATLRALHLPPDADRAVVADAVAERSATDVEESVVSAGAAAAALRTRQEWRAHPQSAAVAERPLVEVTLGEQTPPFGAGESGVPGAEERPRVLDLTRVIAGPPRRRSLRRSAPTCCASTHQASRRCRRSWPTRRLVSAVPASTCGVAARSRSWRRPTWSSAACARAPSPSWDGRPSGSHR
jgi:hypothetical protein